MNTETATTAILDRLSLTLGPRDACLRYRVGALVLSLLGLLLPYRKFFPKNDYRILHEIVDEEGGHGVEIFDRDADGIRSAE